MMDEKLKLVLESLKGGYYGIVRIVNDWKHEHYYLVYVETADPKEEWECADYYLLSKDLSINHHIAHCDGYNGVIMLIAEDEIAKRLVIGENLWTYIKPYEITGELLAAAKFSQCEEADEEWVGKCKVWVKYYYSKTTYNKPVDGFATDGCGNELIFDSYDDAADWVECMYAENYYLDHGELGAPTYTILKFQGD